MLSTFPAQGTRRRLRHVLVVMAALAVSAPPSLSACLNDQEVPKAEGEYRARYAVRSAAAKLSPRSSFGVDTILLALGGALLIGGAAYLLGRRGSRS